MTWSVEFLESAADSVRALDREQQKQVMSAVHKKLKVDPVQFGDRLGNKGGRNLTGWFSIRCDNRGLRIIYTVFDGVVQVVLIAVVDAREEFQAHDHAAMILKHTKEALDLARKAAKIDQKQFAAAYKALKELASTRRKAAKRTGT